MSPKVAIRLAEFTRRDATCMRDVAEALTPAQLAGRSMLPEILPFVPAMSDSVVPRDSTPAASRLLLRAAFDVTGRPEIVLAASAVDASVLLLGPLKQELRIVDGLLCFADERVRSRVVHDSSPFERREAYVELARAARRSGYREAALLYTARSNDLGRQRPLVQSILQEAQSQLERGYTRNAYALAHSVIDSTRDAQAQALSICGRAAFWHGCFDEARELLGRADDHRDLVQLSHRIEQGPAPHPDNRKRGVEVAEWLGEVAEAHADKQAMDGIGTLTELWYSEQFDECDSYGAQLLLTMSALGRSNGWTTQGHRLTPLADAQMCALKSGVQIQAGKLESAAQTISEDMPRMPLEHAAAGVIPKFIRLLVEAGVPVDLALAERFEALLGAQSEKHVAFGPVAGERFVAAAQALAQKAVERADSCNEQQTVPALTPRQQAVLGLVLRGMTNREIGEVLRISERTVEVHVAALLRKMEVDSRSKLIARLHRPRP